MLNKISTILQFWRNDGDFFGFLWEVSAVQKTVAVIVPAEIPAEIPAAIQAQVQVQVQEVDQVQEHI